MKREYKSQTICLERTSIDLEIMLGDFPITTLDGLSVHQQVKIFIKRIKKDIRKVHSMQLVFGDR